MRLATQPMTLVSKRDAAPLRTRLVELEASQCGSGARVAQQWYVLHTRSRQEKAVARSLHAAGIEHYLPLVPRVTYCGHRKRTIDDPLFKCYVFLRGAREQAFFAMSTRRVVQIIDVPDQRTLEHELNQVRLAFAGGAVLSSHPYLHVGRRVRVTAGPFRDVEGLIEDHARPDRLVLQIEALGQATSLEIDAGLLEPLD